MNGFPNLLTPEEAAARLAVSVWTLNKLRRTRGLVAVNVGGSYRYDPADLQQFITTNKGATTA